MEERKKKNEKETQKPESSEFGFMKIDGMEQLMKKQDRIELKILIVTSSEEYGKSLERAISSLSENVESITVCKHKDVHAIYAPGKFTHVIACDSLVSEEYENVKRAKTIEEVQKLEAEGFMVENIMSASSAVHRMKTNIDPDLKKIILVDDAKGYVGHGHKLGVYEKGQYDPNQAILQQPIELKDLLRLLKE